MARRELSSTLKNLKFMQRATVREEEPKKEEEVKPDEYFSSPGPANRKCVVIMEGDPHPGGIKGRMSFQSFNPSIDKLNEEAVNPQRPASSTRTSLDNQNEKMSRENGLPRDEAECSDINEQNCTSNGDLKRKQSDVVFGTQTQLMDTSPGNLQDNQSSSHNTKKGVFKKPKSERPDWKVLRPPKSPSKRS